MMLRNPKDVAVSQYCLYDQHAPLWGPKVSWEEAIYHFTHGKGQSEYIFDKPNHLLLLNCSNYKFLETNNVWLFSTICLKQQPP